MEDKDNKKQPETVLAKQVVDWLTDQKWDVYQEVQIRSYGPVADIVAVFGNLVWVIECKKSLSLKVMEQAYRWRRYANFTSIAVEKKKGQAGSFFAEQVLRKFEIGMLVVNTKPKANSVLEILQAPLNRKATTIMIKERLLSAHKTFAVAGNSEGKRWTPFQQTSQNILHEVKKHPGITMTELMNKIVHHYGATSTARSCISQWAQKGMIKGVCVQRDGRIIKLYPTEQK